MSALDLAGFPVEIDPGRPVDLGGSTVRPRVRTLGDLTPVLARPDALRDPSAPAYYMYRGLAAPEHSTAIGRAGLRFDVTLIPPWEVGGEPAKTFGHYHSSPPGGPPYPELYQVLEGEAAFVLQRPGGAPGELEDLVLVRAGRGDAILIPPGYGHVTVNPSRETLALANVVAESCSSDYSAFARLRGAGIYLTREGPTPNPAYRRVPEVREVPPADLDPLGVSGDPLYGRLVSRPSEFLFLSRPWLLGDRGLLG